MKTKYGYMNCPDCHSDGKASRVLVRVNEHETLSFRCDECDAAPYAKKGDARRDMWERKIERLAPATPATPAADPVPVPKEKPPVPATKPAMPWMRK